MRERGIGFGVGAIGHDQLRLRDRTITIERRLRADPDVAGSEEAAAVLLPPHAVPITAIDATRAKLATRIYSSAGGNFEVLTVTAW